VGFQSWCSAGYTEFFKWTSLAAGKTEHRAVKEFIQKKTEQDSNTHNTMAKRISKIGTQESGQNIMLHFYAPIRLLAHDRFIG
jgi:hypothetical protein